MARILVKGTEIDVPNTVGAGSSFSQATVVRLINPSTSTDYVITVQETAGGTTVGTFTLLRGFHTILVFLKNLHKKYGVLGLKEWWIDSEAIQPGSADKADEGKHYFRSVRLHKQSFEAIVRYRIEKEIELDSMSDQHQNSLQSLRENLSSVTLDELMN